MIGDQEPESTSSSWFRESDLGVLIYLCSSFVQPGTFGPDQDPRRYLTTDRHPPGVLARMYVGICDGLSRFTVVVVEGWREYNQSQPAHTTVTTHSKLETNYRASPFLSIDSPSSSRWTDQSRDELKTSPCDLSWDDTTPKNQQKSNFFFLFFFF